MICTLHITLKYISRCWPGPQWTCYAHAVFKYINSYAAFMALGFVALSRLVNFLTYISNYSIFIIITKLWYPQVSRDLFSQVEWCNTKAVVLSFGDLYMDLCYNLGCSDNIWMVRAVWIRHGTWKMWLYQDKGRFRNDASANVFSFNWIFPAFALNNSELYNHLEEGKVELLFETKFVSNS